MPADSCPVPTEVLAGLRQTIRQKSWTRDKRRSQLYAAGTDACPIYGDIYVFILAGNTTRFDLNSGQVVGENAAEYIRAVAQWDIVEER